MDLVAVMEHFPQSPVGLCDSQEIQVEHRRPYQIDVRVKYTLKPLKAHLLDLLIQVYVHMLLLPYQSSPDHLSVPFLGWPHSF